MKNFDSFLTKINGIIFQRTIFKQRRKIMEQILGMITTYGLETVVIALLVNLLTGLVKMPIDEE